MKLFALLISIYFWIPFSIFSTDCNSVIQSFDDDQPLKSNWKFQKGDNLEWKEIAYDDALWQIKTLPDTGKEKSVRTYGYHWYRCKFIIHDLNILNDYTGIDLGKIRDVDEVYFNGNLIGATGKAVPLQPDSEWERVYSIPKKLLKEGENVIAVRIYSSTDNYGLGFIPVIGNQLHILWKEGTSEVFAVLSGYVFILMGGYLLFGSLVRSSSKSNLFFSLFSINLGIYTLFRTQQRYRFFEDFGNSYRVELIVLYTLPVLFMNFLTFNLNYKRKIFLWGFEFAMLLMAIITIISKTPEQWLLLIEINAYLLAYAMIYCIIIIYKRYRTNAKKLKYIFIGSMFLLPCVIIDVLRAIEIIRFPSTVHFGFMFFLIIISIQLSEEMVQNYQNFLEQEKELIQMEKVKTNFIVNVSGEFGLYLEEIQKAAKELSTKENAPKALEILEAKTALMSSIIDDAVVLNEIETGNYEILYDKFSVKEVAEDIIKMADQRFSQKKRKRNLVISEGDFDLIQCRELFYLIVYHLVENSFVHTPESSAISIEIQKQLSEIIINISDEGPGIPFEKQKEIYQKFMRLDSRRNRNIPGTGIGLTIVKSAIDLLGGKIDLTSSESTGTKFSISLPSKAI